MYDDTDGHWQNAHTRTGGKKFKISIESLIDCIEPFGGVKSV